MLYVFCALALFILIYSVLAAPRVPRRMVPSRKLFAHRGLFDNEHGIPENSLPAFARAIEHGYGIELDIHLTKDDQLIVFHDDSLSRVCKANGDPREMTLKELAQHKLLGTEECIPLFEQVLALVDGRVPLLIELKNCARPRALVLETMKRLNAYKGEYLIESFSPPMLLHLRKANPNVIRGQLVTPASGDDGTVPRPTMLALSLLLLNCLSRPDFVAYNQVMDRSFVIWMQRHLFKTPLAVWTVRSQAEYDRLENRADMPIFEGFVCSFTIP